MYQCQLVTFDASRIKAMASNRLPGWTECRFTKALLEYQRFLTLCKKYPEARIMAPADVDELWHMHMLDSVYYTDDCNRIFGNYLHHDPCIGEADHFNTNATLDLYRELYGEEPGIEWKQMLTCAGPGQGCGSITAISQQIN